MVALTSAGKHSLDELVSKVADEGKIPGFIFGASSIEEEIYFKAAGFNVVNDPSSGEVNPDSILWLCSMTKMVVHISALKLIEQGLLSADTPVSDYFPEFANLLIIDNQMANVLTFKPAKTVMLVKHLLNFSSGLYYPMKNLRRDMQLDAYAKPHDKENPHSSFFSLVKGDLPGIPILFEPGENFAYGFSSDVLGFVIEKATGQTLENYLQENIFKPLGITASFYLTPDLKAKLLSLSYRQDGKLEPFADRWRLFEHDPSKVACHLGGIGLYSSLKDYLILLRHLLQIHAGKLNTTNPILSLSNVQAMFEPASTEAGAKSLAFMLTMDPFTIQSGFRWSKGGIALCTDEWPRMRSKGSGFWSGWAGTTFFIDPTAGVAAIFGSQVLPSMDHDMFRLAAEFEKVLYAGLSS